MESNIGCTDMSQVDRAKLLNELDGKLAHWFSLVGEADKAYKLEQYRAELYLQVLIMIHESGCSAEHAELIRRVREFGFALDRMITFERNW